MKRILLPILLALVLAACGGESSRPVPTGKGTLRAISAIPTAPTVFFLIEERSLGGLTYKQLSVPMPFDDFDYNFNFEAVLAGDLQTTRVATLPFKVEADIEYTFIVTGSIESPTISVLETPVRVFDEGATVFELRLAHLAVGFPTVDVYIAPDGTAPALGEQFATLAFGESSPAVDVEGGEYVVTITAAGDPGNVVFQSNAVTFSSEVAILVGVFAPDANDVDPLSVRGYSATGGLSLIADESSSSTIRFVNAALDLGPVDIYNDEDLTSQLAANVDYREITAEIPVPDGNNDLFVTPAGSTATVLLDSTFSSGFGARNDSYLIGSDGDYLSITFASDRRSVETVARVNLFNASLNIPVADLYVLDDGEEFNDDVIPRGIAINILSGQPSFPVELNASGSYDVYIAPGGERTVAAGPIDLDLTLGDVVNLGLFDTADPNVTTIDVVATP
ncbi:MAG: DUF4397 domain-containing protein [Pseudomonadota bacterium]